MRKKEKPELIAARETWVSFLEKFIVPLRIDKNKNQAAKIGEKFSFEVTGKRWEKILRGSPEQVVTPLTIDGIATDANLSKKEDLYKTLAELAIAFVYAHDDKIWDDPKEQFKEKRDKLEAMGIKFPPSPEQIETNTTASKSTDCNTAVGRLKAEKNTKLYPHIY